MPEESEEQKREGKERAQAKIRREAGKGNKVAQKMLKNVEREQRKKR